MSIIAWLIGTKTGQYIAGGFLIVATICIILLKIFSLGKNAEKHNQTIETLNNVRNRIKTDNEISSLNASDRARKLREWTRD